MLDYQLNDGAQSLDQQQTLDWQRGYQVTNAAGGSNIVSAPSSGGLAVDIDGGDVLFGGATVSCASVTDFSLPAADPEHPRTDVVYRDAVGDPQYKEGIPGDIKPEGVQARDRDAAAPSPYPMHDIDGVVLATVWVPAGATSITTADIRDRRMPASLDVDQLNATSVDANSVSTADGTIGGDPLLGGPSASSNPSVSFGNYQTAASPLIVEVFCLAETDGSSNGDVRLQVDEDSDGTVEKEISAAFASSDLPTGLQSRESAMVYVPEGGQYRIANENDPNGSNLIVDVYENEL